MPGCAKAEARRKIVDHVIVSLTVFTMVTMAMTPYPCYRDKAPGAHTATKEQPVDPLTYLPLSRRAWWARWSLWAPTRRATGTTALHNLNHFPQLQQNPLIETY